MSRARILPACLVLALLAGGLEASAEGWSLGGLSPFGKSTQPQKTPTKTSKKEPSSLEKLSSGTKKLFTQVGDTLTLKKKPAQKKPINPYASSIRSGSTSQQPQKKSWFGSLLQPKEPKKQMTPTDWIGQPRVDF
jgi:hypothetical protein